MEIKQRIKAKAAKVNRYNDRSGYSTRIDVNYPRIGREVQQLTSGPEPVEARPILGWPLESAW